MLLEPPTTLVPSKSVEPVVLVPCVDGLPIAPVVEPPELNGALPSVPGIPPVVELPVVGVPPRVPGMPPVMELLTPGLTIVGLEAPLKARPRACASAGPATNAWATRIATRKPNNRLVFLPKS